MPFIFLLLLMETKAYDNYSAMKRAYSALEIFLRYLEVFLNDNISVIGKNGLVIRQDTQEGIILPVKAFGYKSIKPEPRENFKTEIDTIVLGCQEKGKETYSQLSSKGHLPLCQKYRRPSAECPQAESIRY